MAEDNPAIVTQYKIVPDYKTPKMERMEVAKHILEVSPPPANNICLQKFLPSSYEIYNKLSRQTFLQVSS